MRNYEGWNDNESPYITPPREPLDLHLAYVSLGCGIGGLVVAVLGHLANRIDPGDGGAVIIVASTLMVSAIGYWRIRGYNRLVDDWHRAIRHGEEGVDWFLDWHYHGIKRQFPGDR